MTNLYRNLPPSTKPLYTFIKSQENLSHTRFIQGTATNWLPKAIFSRSKADFGDITFLELFESVLFYYAPSWVGEGLIKKGILKKVINKKDFDNINKHITDSVKDIVENKNLQDNKINKKTLAAKTALVTGFAIVPILEYALGYAKNLFTLKVFKKSNFDNIANLDKNQGNENIEQQQKVEKNAKKQLKRAGIFSITAIISSALIAKYGHKSNKAQSIFKYLLEPANLVTKAFPKIKGGKLDKFLQEYTKLDFNNNNGKLGLCKGQLAVTTISGLFGYSNAAKDRGKLDFLEVWTRVPLVVFYTIFGSALFDSGFKKLLIKNGKFKDLLQKGKDVPTLKELPKLAQKLTPQGGSTQDVFKRLVKEKSIITGIPYIFSLFVMGFTLAGISRLWTQYRYEHQKKNDLTCNKISFEEYLKTIKTKF